MGRGLRGLAQNDAQAKAYALGFTGAAVELVTGIVTGLAGAYEARFTTEIDDEIDQAVNLVTDGMFPAWIPMAIGGGLILTGMAIYQFDKNKKGITRACNKIKKAFTPRRGSKITND